MNTYLVHCEGCGALANLSWGSCAGCGQALSRKPLDTTIEPAEPNARPIFWERANGQICGPATHEFQARVGSGPKAIYLVVAQFLGEPVFINSTALRSQVQFETQPTLRTVEPIREPQ